MCRLGGGGQRFHLESAEEIRGGSQPHRGSVIRVDDYGDESRPSVSELVIRVSWMLGGMRYQASKISTKRDIRSHASKLHRIFPVCYSYQSSVAFAFPMIYE